MHTGSAGMKSAGDAGPFGSLWKAHLKAVPKVCCVFSSNALLSVNGSLPGPSRFIVAGAAAGDSLIFAGEGKVFRRFV